MALEFKMVLRPPGALSLSLSLPRTAFARILSVQRPLSSLRFELKFGKNKRKISFKFNLGASIFSLYQLNDARRSWLPLLHGDIAVETVELYWWRDLCWCGGTDCKEGSGLPCVQFMNCAQCAYQSKTNGCIISSAYARAMCLSAVEFSKAEIRSKRIHSFALLSGRVSTVDWVY